MPPSRRRIPAPQPPVPARRPRVAGLRKPSPTKRSPEPAETTETTETTETNEPTGTTGTTGTNGAPGTPDTGSGTGEADETRTEHTRAPEPVESGEPEPVTPVTSDDELPKQEAGRDKPSPRPKTRDRGTARPTDADQVDVTDEDAEAAVPRTGRDSGREDSDSVEETSRSRRAGYPVLAALLAATLVLSGLAVFFKVKHGEATELTANTAMVDVASTAEVKQAMQDAAQRLFSVNYQDMGATDEAADRFLASEEVRRTYDALMGDYRQQATEQKIVVTTTAVRSAVVLLDGDRARVMVYVDQMATRAGSEQPMGGPAAMWFEAERRDGAWKVADLNVYGASQSDTRSGAAPAEAEPSSSQAGDSTEGN
ncbi:hypothetical protein [Saccharomonospora cyanea]|uniref:Mce-associated membrane protein n=1 Tax=Saccharomonospora cyanea NA-134 TaxID=882082 RepID=H5XFN1_9PSEU|nr:hypothetical protein [Saccharomonospora cyanea]EHR59402.1 hypothetical protein SaccyDRAFT_0474 [Saccharomonospora cyanea NA-134]